MLLEEIFQNCERLEGLEPEEGIIEEAVTVHFNKFNKQGLNVVAMFFKRKGYKVSSIEPEDKVKKKDGIPTKKVIFNFENGQKLEMVFAFNASGKQKIEKTLGSTFLAKVDGKKVPISISKKDEHKTIKALEKIVKFLEASSPRESKVSKEELKVKPNKKLIQSLKNKTAEAGERNFTLNKDLETIIKENDLANKRDGEATELNIKLKNDLSDLKEEAESLELELKTLEKVA
jgi:hypothetical protein